MKWKDQYTILMIAAAMVIAGCVGFAIKHVHKSDSEESFKNESDTIVETYSNTDGEKENTLLPKTDIEDDIYSENTDDENSENYEPDFIEIDNRINDNEQFGILSDVLEDYSNALYPEEYLYYDSGISDFSFWYPANLYNNVVLNTNLYDDQYGTSVQTVTFSASMGSEVSYRIFSRNDSLSIDEMTEYVYATEKMSLIEPEDIIHSCDDDHGKVIVTGWDNDYHEKAIYDMLKIEDNYILQMKVIFPDYVSEEDRLQKGYVTECYYRMCGFSDSQYDYRTYEEYLEAGSE